MSYISFDNLVEEIKQDMKVTSLFRFNKYSGGEKKKANVEPSKTCSRTNLLTNFLIGDVQHMYCSAKHSVSEDAFKCLGLNATTHDLLDIAQQMLPGAWIFTSW